MKRFSAVLSVAAFLLAAAAFALSLYRFMQEHGDWCCCDEDDDCDCGCGCDDCAGSELFDEDAPDEAENPEA